MTNELIERKSFAQSAVVADGRILSGMAVPYNVVQNVRDRGGPLYRERWITGAFAKNLRERKRTLPLMYNHQSTRYPLGPITLLREDETGLIWEGRLSKTREADDVLELINDGLLTGVSIGAIATVSTTARDGVIERRQASLRELSLTDDPAYEQAGVFAQRTAQGESLLTRMETQAKMLTKYLTV